MKEFKRIDFCISIALISAAILCLPIKPVVAFMIGYFGLGTWHVISIVIHFFNKWFCEKGSARDNYHLLIFIILLLALVGMLLTEILWVVAFVLLFAAPLMAVFYTNLCYNEVYIKMKRPLDQLK
jgi:hypothetical protein